LGLYKDITNGIYLPKSPVLTRLTGYGHLNRLRSP